MGRGRCEPRPHGGGTRTSQTRSHRRRAAPALRCPADCTGFERVSYLRVLQSDGAVGTASMHARLSS